MATGSGKTVVMAMLIAWAFCNRGRVRSDERFPQAVLVCCPNLTVKERLQVLRPENPSNYYEVFDLVPTGLRPLMQAGRVLVTNWHALAPEGEHVEGGRSYGVVNKGQETADAFARRVLGDLYDRAPIMVLNDEAHHAYRPRPMDEETSARKALTAEEKAEREEATVWIAGLDRINVACGIRFCVDFSATPFYLAGSGYVEGSPFPWLVSDFGLVDAIESGIVKIPRLPVSDVTGRPEPKYFHLYRHIVRDLQPIEKVGHRPKPHVAWREAQGALEMLAGQYKERFEQSAAAKPGQVGVPPVMIVICENTDMAEHFYEQISGERIEEDGEEEPEDPAEGEADDVADGPRRRKKRRIVYEGGKVQPEIFSNHEGRRYTIRIDSKLLAEAESEDPDASRKSVAEELRRIVATVGKSGEPGEQVRCVVSVSMLTEGWDANNVTHILGLRPFESQLLCEQVVGRGLRRMDYAVDPQTGKLTPEYVDIYGIPFSLIPYKGRPTHGPAPDDRPLNHVFAMGERDALEIRFPIVDSYAFALRRNLIRCDVAAMEPLAIEPNREPTAVFVVPRVTYEEFRLSRGGPGEAVKQDREAYYRSTHLQQIEFEIARRVVTVLTDANAASAKMRYQSRQQLFPQVLRVVHHYVKSKVDFRGQHQCELGLAKYVDRLVERLCQAIEPDESAGEPPLIPVLNRYRPWGSSRSVNFKTKRPCHWTTKSHVNQIVLDTETWESSAAFRLEESQHVECYVRNDHLGFVIPYEYQGVTHGFEPDFLVRLRDKRMLIVEIKGYESDQSRAKHQAAQRWVSAVNRAGRLGRWSFMVCRDPQMLGCMISAQADRDW